MKSKIRTLPIILFLIFLVGEISIIKNYYREKSSKQRKASLTNASDLKNAIRKFPLNSENYYRLSTVLSKDVSNKNKTELLLQRAYELNPLGLRYNIALADHYRKNGNPEKALEFYKKSLAILTPSENRIKSEIYCYMARTYLETNDPALFQGSLKKAKALFKDNWRIDFLHFQSALQKENIEQALELFKSSLEKFNREPHQYSPRKDSFRTWFDKTIKNLLYTGRFEDVKILYDQYVLLSHDIESTLVALVARFEASPDLANRIWGEKVHITLLNLRLAGQPSLVRHGKDCQIENIEHAIEKNEEVYETLKIRYSSTPSFIDLWYLPLKIKVKSPKTSLKIKLKSSVELYDRQLALEIGDTLFYSKGTTSKNGQNEYILDAKNVLRYIPKNLISQTKNYNIVLTKLGFNTACRSGDYKIENFQIYLED